MQSSVKRNKDVELNVVRLALALIILFLTLRVVLEKTNEA